MAAVEKGLPVVAWALDKSTGIGTVTLQRPHAKNAVNDFVYNAAIEALDNLEKDEACGVVMITGAGDYFCAGADLVAGFDPMVGPLKSGRGSFHDPVGRFMSKVIRFPKPLVAAVNGPAVGIGATIIPHCDVVYCTESAFFWTPFTNLSVCPEFCSSVTFKEILPASVANEMLLFGKRLSATEAAAHGFVSQVLPSEGFLDAVRAKLEPTLAALHSGRSLRLFKALSKDHEHVQRMERVHQREMKLLDDRSTGSNSEAALAVAAMQAAAQKAKKAKL